MEWLAGMGSPWKRREAGNAAPWRLIPPPHPNRKPAMDAKAATSQSMAPSKQLQLPRRPATTCEAVVAGRRFKCLGAPARCWRVLAAL